jgi:hypothetical protein
MNFARKGPAAGTGHQLAAGVVTGPVEGIKRG